MDLVVADLKLAGEITGRELYNWICRWHRQLPGRVVFTMSDARTEGIGALMEEERLCFIQKPFDVERFLGVIRRVLDQRGASALKC